MNRNQLHYHIRWSRIARLDWECFSTGAQAEANAKQFVRQQEAYTIEEHDHACLRCADAMKAKTAHGSFSEASV
jgi:hypothetical protein